VYHTVAIQVVGFEKAGESIQALGTSILESAIRRSFKDFKSSGHWVRIQEFQDKKRLASNGMQIDQRSPSFSKGNAH